METVQKTENNNQNIHIQKFSSTPDNESAKEVYECTNSILSRESVKITPHQQKSKHNEAIDNHSRYKTLSILRANDNWCQNRYENLPEEPIDLTCSEKRHPKRRNTDVIQKVPLARNHSNFDLENQPSFGLAEFQRIQNPNNVKRRGRKRKYETRNDQISELTVSDPEATLIKTLDNQNYFQIADNKQAEVIKAAKSLFSKRTRTLYHWMYPTAPKAQLKAAVASSWETLGIQEKEFYISQVLGRFGFPQTNLMVNPQLGGISGDSHLPLLDPTTSSHVGTEETSTAVTTLLMTENRNNNEGYWDQSSQTHSLNSADCTYSQRIYRRRGRLGRPPGSKNKRPIKEEIAVVNHIKEEPAPEEFQDDPELNQEFQQFKWTLHLNDNEKS